MDDMMLMCLEIVGGAKRLKQRASEATAICPLLPSWVATDTGTKGGRVAQLIGKDKVCECVTLSEEGDGSAEDQRLCQHASISRGAGGDSFDWKSKSTRNSKQQSSVECLLINNLLTAKVQCWFS